MSANLIEEFGEVPAVLRRFQPEWGIVLGSGLGPFVDAIETEATVPFNEVPGMPESRVPGHAGRFVLGRVGGKRVLIAQAGTTSATGAATATGDCCCVRDEDRLRASSARRFSS